ncbi:MAG: c-type cytochrome, partial [Pirellulales bacterium]
PPGRSFEVGKQLFTVATCVACHQLDNEGDVFGPDLAKLDEKKHTTEHILRSMVEPSQVIDAKYLSYAFVLDSGKVTTGMIMEETADAIKVVIDPLAKSTPTVIRKDEIEEQRKSSVSLMPAGLLNRLTREEILDLVAFVYSGGDKKSAMFAEHDH